jgi:hypothetical protein
MNAHLTGSAVEASQGNGDVTTRVAYMTLNPNPYAEVPTEALADALEVQYERGEPFTPEIVFEVLDRLVQAQGLGLPPAR